MLAVAGASRLPEAWASRAAALATVGLVLALTSAVPGVRDVYSSLTGTVAGAAMRESQRWLMLFLVWLAPAAAHGASRLGARALLGAPVACGLALAAPGLWGVGGRLEPVEIPAGWAAAARAIDQRPGPVLALPWHQYLDVSFADGRRVLNPLPDYLGGDVLTSSDPELGDRGREQADRREPIAGRLVRHMTAGESVSTELASLGVRWVVVIHEVDWRGYATSVGRDRGLEHAVRTDSVDLYRVRGWRGPVVDRAGRTVPLGGGPAIARGLEPSGAAVWQRAGLEGWMRGTRQATPSPAGTLGLPAGRGLAWYWPGLLVVLGYLCTLCAGVRACSDLLSDKKAVPSASRR